jgi:uncharacterized glyoxalase superfamily protein PhnB
MANGLIINTQRNMFPHNFDESLSREQAQQAKADAFYHRQFGATDIVRYTDNTEDHMILQRQDIDLSFIKAGKQYLVSEKFREKDFGDLYLETYSKYPGTKGWMHTNRADLLAYFFPTRMLLINKKKLMTFYHETLTPSVSEAFYAKLYNEYRNRSKIMTQSIRLKGADYKINIIQAFNRTGNSTWHTIGVSIPFELLDVFNVTYRIYPL